MIRTVVTCDFCGDEIRGEYRKLRQEFTNMDEAQCGYNDMCMNCLKMVTDYKRVPVFSYGEIENAALQ